MGDKNMGMTREELKKHCQKQIKNCEMWARHNGEEPHGKVYEEHKLILELLEQEPTTKNNSSELEKNSKKLEKDFGESDCISRAEMLRYQQYLHGKMSNEENHKLWEFIKELPPATPQEPRKGHWIKVHPLQENDEGDYMCSECKCGGLVWKSTTYCPNCGVKMEKELKR